MPNWDGLAREWDLWRDFGSVPNLWWRDDDAVAATPQLAELKQVAGVTPLALAVIPIAPDRPLDPSLPAALKAWPTAAVLQHGIAHLNHAEPGAKKGEFPATRPFAEISLGLPVGQERLRDEFGSQFLPVLTPPWNRIAGEWVTHLPGLGFRGLSRFGEPPFKRSQPVPGLREVNTHVDVIDWRGSRGFAGEAAVLGRLTGHLAARRQGTADASEPTGLLTHHLVHDTATWRFLENLQDWLARRGEGAAFMPPAALWPPL